MRNLFKGITLVILFSLTTTIFGINEVRAQSETGLSNMTLVEVIKDQVFSMSTECGTIYSDKVTFQNKNGMAHNYTLIFTLPEDHCWVQKATYTLDWGPYFRVIINPGGKMIVKLINN